MPSQPIPADYGATLTAIKLRVQQERVRVVLAANSAMVLLYWDIGSLILERQTREGWGAKIIDRLARDLRRSFPDMQGFSSRNLLFMRRFAEEFPEATIVKQLVSQLPWGHVIRLMQRVEQPEVREWYMREAIQQGWSRSVLEIQLLGNAYQRQGRAVNNFASALPLVESRRAAEVFKDPYLFDFLGTTDLNRERQVEQALVDHIQRFMLELGSGFAFVGRQVRLPVGDDDFFIDLLFYHLKLRSYLVIELKTIPFDPAFAGQINLYLSAVDDQLRHPDDRPTIGQRSANDRPVALPVETPANCRIRLEGSEEAHRSCRLGNDAGESPSGGLCRQPADDRGTRSGAGRRRA